MGFPGTGCSPRKGTARLGSRDSTPRLPAACCIALVFGVSEYGCTPKGYGLGPAKAKGSPRQPQVDPVECLGCFTGIAGVGPGSSAGRGYCPGALAVSRSADGPLPARFRGAFS